MDFGEELGVEGNVGRRLGVGHHIGQAAIEVPQKRHQIEAEVAGEVGLEVAMDAAMEAWISPW